MILKLNTIATMFAINRKYIFKMIYYCVLKHIVINILNNTPVQFEIDEVNNTIKIPQITNQTVIDFLKQQTFQRGETYPRYQLVLIP